MPPLRLLSVPYDSGHRSERQGLGPERIVDAWKARGGHDAQEAELSTLQATSDFPTEIATTFELMGSISRGVSGALEEGRSPVVLTGNCNTSAVGGPAGLRAAYPEEHLCVVWCDGHGDFATPDTDDAGFLDGQGLAMLTGRCWGALTGKVPGYLPLDASRVLLVGGHDVPESQLAALEEAGVTRVSPERISEAGVAEALADVLGSMAEAGSRAYLHVDLDVIDAGHGMANAYAAPGGLTPAQLLETIRLVGEQLSVSAAAVSAYDPTVDVDRRIEPVALDVLDSLSSALV